MRAGRGWVAVASPVLAAIVGACSSATTALPSPSIPTAPERTTTTSPYAVPAVIDAAYVNRILAALDALQGDTIRWLAANKSTGSYVASRLRAIYDDTTYSEQTRNIARAAADGYRDIKPNPGNVVTTVTSLVVASSRCIFAKANWDATRTLNNPDPQLSVLWVGLVPQDKSRDPDGFNTTGWMYAYRGFRADHSQPDSPCVA